MWRFEASPRRATPKGLPSSFTQHRIPRGTYLEPVPLFLRSWHTDITYLPIEDGTFCYLATVMDLCSRRLAGWAIADHMRTDLVIDALTAAQRTRGSLAGAIFHSDHGAQYTSRAFADACRQAGVIQSMGTVGSSADNAAAESLNAAFKRETLQGARAWRTEREARLAAFGWLHRYNTRRRHSHLGQRSPITYENSLIPTSATLPQVA